MEQVDTLAAVLARPRSGVVNSVQSHWSDAVRGYREAPTRFFNGRTQTGCGAATAAVGPFYCPADPP
jgi:predicted metalloprotease